MNQLSIYIHWPFCRSKCPYCSFNSVTNPVPENFIDKYLKELEFYKNFITSAKLVSIYFGGGTPSLMKLTYLEKILNKINTFTSIDDSEITIEINPGTITYDILKNYKSLGINRVSLGIQSLNSDNLKFLQRNHTFSDVIQAINDTKSLFSNYNLDFIYTLPDQNLSKWLEELQSIIELQANHLSMYQLTIEEGTPFEKLYNNFVSDEISYEFYTSTHKILTNAGYKHYEVSNFAKPSYESKHNLIYWNYDDFIGIGPGASGRLTIKNTKCEIVSIKNIYQWLEEPNIKICPLSTEECETEALLMGLRTINGVSISKITGIYKKNKTKIQQLVQDGLLIDNKKYLIASEEGILKMNAILMEIT